MFRVLGFSGSLREGSFNTLLLRALPPLLPAGMSLEIFEGIGELPLYDQDLDGPAEPPAVRRFRDAVRAADALVVVAPEYNHTVAPVTKNAVDWASRPVRDVPLTGKGVVTLVATPGRALGFRALADLGRIIGDLGNLVVPQPEVVLNSAHTMLGTDGSGAPVLTDPTARYLIGTQFKILADLLAADAPGVLARSIEKHWDARLPGSRG
ncbi:NADPH-dependent FMN reductase [Streptomyces sp. NPDC091292]|uniref:NADPH-dependent FMN reductase n=1 Tax=Streptomyces sp. NPDC091292 TaxID=3365991 RepID=UPI003827FAEC